MKKQKNILHIYNSNSTVSNKNCKSPLLDTILSESVQSTTWHPIPLISPVYLLLGLTSGLIAAGSPHVKYAQRILPSWSRSL